MALLLKAILCVRRSHLNGSDNKMRFAPYDRVIECPRFVILCRHIDTLTKTFNNNNNRVINVISWATFRSRQFRCSPQMSALKRHPLSKATIRPILYDNQKRCETVYDISYCCSLIDFQYGLSTGTKISDLEWPEWRTGCYFVLWNCPTLFDTICLGGSGVSCWVLPHFCLFNADTIITQ